MSDLIPLNFDVDQREPRIRDIDLAERLGMTDPHSIRRIIERSRVELESYGEVSDRRSETSQKGGRPGLEYWLNEGQALLLCMFSRTPLAARVRLSVIETFMMWRRGRYTRVNDLTPQVEILGWRSKLYVPVERGSFVWHLSRRDPGNPVLSSASYARRIGTPHKKLASMILSRMDRLEPHGWLTREPMEALRENHRDLVPIKVWPLNHAHLRVLIELIKDPGERLSVCQDIDSLFAAERERYIFREAQRIGWAEAVSSMADLVDTHTRRIEALN